MGQPSKSIAFVNESGRLSELEFIIKIIKRSSKELALRLWIENRLTKSRPLIVHFPGNSKIPAMMPCTDRPNYDCQQSLPFEARRVRH